MSLDGLGVYLDLQRTGLSSALSCSHGMALTRVFLIARCMQGVLDDFDDA